MASSSSCTLEIMGSMTSVATVRENKPAAVKDEVSMDVDALYDDVMQCVYDDVDTKYDDLVEAAPPPPPVRMRQDSALNTPESPEKPLPGTPSKLPTLLAMMTPGKGAAGATLTAEERQRQKELAERVRAEKAKQKEREKLRTKRAKAEGGNKASLFQRVFHRSKSQSELANLGGAPTRVPPKPEVFGTRPGFV